jgi:hypothetical protein
MDGVKNQNAPLSIDRNEDCFKPQGGNARGEMDSRSRGKSYMELRSRRIDEMSDEDLVYVIEYILNA